MTSNAETPRTVSARWRHIIERQIDLADWSPRRVDEQRHVPRVPWRGRVRVRCGSKLHACRGIDISEHGMRFEAKVEVEVGAMVPLTVALFGHVLRGLGEVTWVGAFRGVQAVGLEFSVMRGHDRRRLANYVASHLYVEGPARGCATPWDDGKTLQGRRSGPPLLPVVPDYVPVRTGHTVAVQVGNTERILPDGTPPSLERLS